MVSGTVAGSACWRPCSPSIAGTSAMGDMRGIVGSYPPLPWGQPKGCARYDLKAAARRGPTRKTWAQMFSVGFGDLCPTYGVKLLPINETSRISTTPSLLGGGAICISQ